MVFVEQEERNFSEKRVKFTARFKSLFLNLFEINRTIRYILTQKYIQMCRFQVAGAYSGGRCDFYKDGFAYCENTRCFVAFVAGFLITTDS